MNPDNNTETINSGAIKINELENKIEFLTKKINSIESNIDELLARTKFFIQKDK